MHLLLLQIKKIKWTLDMFMRVEWGLWIDNKDFFEGLGIVDNQNMETVRNNRNRELMQETIRMVEKKLKPFRDEVKVHQDQLDVSLEDVFYEDENKKWFDYKKSKLEKSRSRRGGNDVRNRPDNIVRRSGR